MPVPTSPIVPALRPGITDCWNRIGVRGDRSCPELSQYVHCRNCPVYAAAAADLLDAALPEGYAEEWTGHFSQPKPVQELDTQSVVLFRLGAEWLALPVAVFREIAGLRPVHSLPHRRGGAVLGLVNVRGELLVCVSLSHLLGVDAPAAKGPARNAAQRLLVVSRDRGRIAFPVDEVHGIHRFHPRELKEVPATLARAAAAHTTAVLAWRDKTVGCLDDERLFHTLNRSLA